MSEEAANEGSDSGSDDSDGSDLEENAKKPRRPRSRLHSGDASMRPSRPSSAHAHARQMSIQIVPPPQQSSAGHSAAASSGGHSRRPSFSFAVPPPLPRAQLHHHGSVPSTPHATNSLAVPGAAATNDNENAAHDDNEDAPKSDLTIGVGLELNSLREEEAADLATPNPSSPMPNSSSATAKHESDSPAPPQTASSQHSDSSRPSSHAGSDPQPSGRGQQKWPRPPPRRQPSQRHPQQSETESAAPPARAQLPPSRGSLRTPQSAAPRSQEEADLDMVLRGLGVVPPSARKQQVELQPVEDTVEAWIIGRLQKFDIFGDRRESHRKSEVTRCFLYA